MSNKKNSKIIAEWGDPDHTELFLIFFIHIQFQFILFFCFVPQIVTICPDINYFIILRKCMYFHSKLLLVNFIVVKQKEYWTWHHWSWISSCYCNGFFLSPKSSNGMYWALRYTALRSTVQWHYIILHAIQYHAIRYDTRLHDTTIHC